MANRAWGWCLVGALAIGMVAGEALLGCGHSGAVAPGGETQRLRVLENGTFSGVRQDGERVFRTPGEWEGFYAQHRAAPPPPVDFTQEMVVAVVLSRNTGGFDVAIDGAVATGGELVVTYTERRPHPEAVVIQVLTQPYAIVAVPRHEGAVRWVHRTETSPAP